MKIGNIIVEKMLSLDGKATNPNSISSISELELKRKRKEMVDKISNLTNDECIKEKLNRWVSSKSFKELEDLENDTELLFEQVWSLISYSVCNQIADVLFKEFNLEAMMQQTSFSLSDDDKEKLTSVIKGYISEALKEECVPNTCIDTISKDVVSNILNKIDKSSTVNETDNVIDVECEDENIQFDDSNLVEVDIENDNVDGFIVNAKGHVFGIDHTDLLSLNNKSYISNRCFEYHTRDIQKSEVEKLKNNEWFNKLMSTLDPSLNIRTDIIPKGNNIFDLRFFIPNGNNNSFDVTLDLGTYITSVVKLSFPTEKGLIGIPVGSDTNLLTNLLTYRYSLEELEKMNCLPENILNISSHINLTQVPSSSLNKIVENIYSNKKLLEKIISNVWSFDKIETANNFVISSIRDDGKNEKVTYNKGKVTSKLDV